MSMTFYPAVFHKADQIEKGYWVEVPDLPGCFSQGDSMEEAFKEVQEAVGLYLDENNDFNKPSPIEKIQQDFPSDSVMLVPYDSVAYAKKYKNKAIKKTLSIPEWLNEEASKRGINFSQVLQEALINKIK